MADASEEGLGSKWAVVPMIVVVVVVGWHWYFTCDPHIKILLT
jgi:hypothetical protein